MNIKYFQLRWEGGNDIVVEKLEIFHLIKNKKNANFKFYCSCNVNNNNNEMAYIISTYFKYLLKLNHTQKK